ncbi:hypothetical protein P691DRAFT_805602 [Macrolepiota fuliginosa MF-IS2]|uniref:WW domain-containing protein n=1 Tax=Macrolepiota fuliginosa MF-IS2 TaxID=1400762 RepID=A0A9P6C558_9AGAR|nr:hypothetical protein P691DRAFT_805602 [Macrolepiota fuliginosa MF-IS2]
MATNEQEQITPQIEAVGKGEDEPKSTRSSPSPASNKGKGKEKTSQGELPADEEQEKSGDSSNSSRKSSPENNDNAPEAQPWQAIYAPQYNAYYFFNSQTGETTWTNPLQPSDPTAPTDPTTGLSDTADASVPEAEQPSASTSQVTALQAAALAQGIDPSLAHLDPALLTATTSASGGPIPTFQAKFNARTGAFTRPDARTPGHLSEYERMKRMSEFYFDVNAWEEQLADDKDQEEEEGNGKKRKRPSKKDLERFKEQKRLKKIAKTAWLRT